MMERSVSQASEALASDRYFDGIQAINNAFEIFEAGLRSPDLPPFEPMDILRNPTEFVQRISPTLTGEERTQLSNLYAIRAELLVGLGAGKRAILDLGVAVTLSPDEKLAQRRQELETTLTSSQSLDKVPTTIITGFLGAGKTTLLNHILSEHHGKRIAVIENEFGEVGIDDSLLQLKSSVMEENVIEMNNGCICCTVRGDLITGLKKLHKQTAGKGKPLDAILIETTGLADPAPVAQTFFADDFVQSKMRLDGILTVVDAKHCMEHLREEKPDGVVNEAVEQVAFADRILLNKTDLVTAEYLDEVEGNLRAISKNAQIRRTQDSKVDLDFIIGIQAFSLDNVLEQVNENFLQENGHGEGHGEGHEEGHVERGHAHGHADGDSNAHGHGGARTTMTHTHDYRITSVGIQTDREVRKEELDNFLGWLMRVKGPNLFRSKGVLAVHGMPRKFVFQAVHMQFGSDQKDLWKEGEKRCCKLVFIGKNLDRQELNAKFEEALF